MTPTPPSPPPPTTAAHTPAPPTPAPANDARLGPDFPVSDFLACPSDRRRVAPLREGARDLSHAELLNLLERVLHDRERTLDGMTKDELRREIELTSEAARLVDTHLNKSAERYDDGRPPKHWRWRAHKAFFLERLRPGDRVLDVGCGSSAYLRWMSEMGCLVTGCDLVPERVEKARRQLDHPNLTLEVRDVVANPPAEPFDVVICSHVIEHIDDPVPLLAALRRNAPRLLVGVPPAHNSWKKVTLRELGLRWMDDADHRREYTPAMLRDQLERAGWVVDTLHDGVDIKADAHRA